MSLFCNLKGDVAEYLAAKDHERKSIQIAYSNNPVSISNQIQTIDSDIKFSD